MREGAPAQVSGDALAEPGHGVEPRRRAHGKRCDENRRPERRTIKRAGAAREALVDDAAHALAEQEHKPGRGQQRCRRGGDPPGIGLQQGQEQAQGGEALHAVILAPDVVAAVMRRPYGGFSTEEGGGPALRGVGAPHQSRWHFGVMNAAPNGEGPHHHRWRSPSEPSLSTSRTLNYVSTLAS